MIQCFVILFLSSSYLDWVLTGPCRKMVVNTQNAELEALEARLRATEERLRAKTGGKIPGKTPNGLSVQQPRSSPNGQQAKQATTNSAGRNPRPGTVSATGRPGTADRLGPQVAKKPIPVQDDSDDDEDTEEDEDESSTEESSEEEVPRMRK